jgi:hypothetical protein
MYMFTASVLHVWVERGQVSTNHYAVYSTRNNWEYEEFVNYCISIAQNNPSYGQYLCLTSLNIAGTFLHSNGNIDVLQEDVINEV